MKAKINVLVTGASGQLGLSLKDESQLHPDVNFSFFNSSELDITDKKQLKSVLKNKDFDYCINCAAYTNVELAESESEKAFGVNFQGVKNLVAAFKEKTTTLIHISTDYVFDGKKTAPYVEDDITNPINIYGKSKLAGEEYLRENFKKHIIVRTSWLYSQYGKNFLKTVVHKLTNGESLTISNSQKGVPTGCIALSKFVMSLIKSKNTEFGVYHFAPNGETNWYKFGLEISKNLKALKINIPEIQAVDNYKTIAQRPENSVLSNKKAEKIFPQIVNWKIEVEETVKKLTAS